MGDRVLSAFVWLRIKSTGGAAEVIVICFMVVQMWVISGIGN